MLAGDESTQFGAQIQLDWREFMVWTFSIRLVIRRGEVPFVHRERSSCLYMDCEDSMPRRGLGVRRYLYD